MPSRQMRLVVSPTTDVAQRLGNRDGKVKDQFGSAWITEYN
jgi:hypothetical protein